MDDEPLTAGATLLFVFAVSILLLLFLLLEPENETRCLEMLVNLLSFCQQLRNRCVCFLRQLDLHLICYREVGETTTN